MSDGRVFCDQCGTSLSAQDRFCDECGAPQPEPIGPPTAVMAPEPEPEPEPAAARIVWNLWVPDETRRYFEGGLAPR